METWLRSSPPGTEGRGRGMPGTTAGSSHPALLQSPEGGGGLRSPGRRSAGEKRVPGASRAGQPGRALGQVPVAGGTWGACPCLSLLGSPRSRPSRDQPCCPGPSFDAEEGGCAGRALSVTSGSTLLSLLGIFFVFQGCLVSPSLPCLGRWGWHVWRCQRAAVGGHLQPPSWSVGHVRARGEPNPTARFAMAKRNPAPVNLLRKQRRLL